ESLGVPPVDCYNVAYLLLGRPFYFLLEMSGKLLKLCLKFLNLGLKLGAGLPHHFSSISSFRSWTEFGAIFVRCLRISLANRWISLSAAGWWRFWMTQRQARMLPVTISGDAVSLGSTARAASRACLRANLQPHARISTISW